MWWPFSFCGCGSPNVIVASGALYVRSCGMRLKIRSKIVCGRVVRLSCQLTLSSTAIAPYMLMIASASMATELRRSRRYASAQSGCRPALTIAKITAATIRNGTMLLMMGPKASQNLVITVRIHRVYSSRTRGSTSA